MNDERTIQLDRMRFTKNTLSANFALLAILLDVCFFISIYETNAGSYYYNILMGASILYNLIFLLAAFLSSEGVKNYNVGYSYLLILLGIIQIARIFIYPVRAHAAELAAAGGEMVKVMGTAQFVRVVLYLALSALCCFVSAVVGIQRSRALSAHLATLNTQAA